MSCACPKRDATPRLEAQLARNSPIKDRVPRPLRALVMKDTRRPDSLAEVYVHKLFFYAFSFGLNLNRIDPTFPTLHCASTNLRRAGVDTVTAMKIVGHESEKMWNGTMR